MPVLLPVDEAERLAALQGHQILDTPPAEEFDDLVRLAAQVCGVTIAAVSLIDENRQWFKAVTGLPITEISRDVAFCAHTILQSGVLIIPDAQTDARFADNPLVTGDPHIRFYAGAPLVSADGYALGSLCVIDRTPRTLTPDQETTLRLLARQVSSHFRATRRIVERERLVAEREASLTAEREFSHAVLESLQAGIVACDANGVLTRFNAATRQFHHQHEQPLRPEQWAEHFNLYKSDGLTPMRMEDIPLYRALQGEVVRDTELVIAPEACPARTLLASGQSLYGIRGEKLGAVVAMHDVTERRQAERELARLAAIVESSEEAIIAATLDGTLVSWNKGAERLYGYAAAEMIGQHASVLSESGQEHSVGSVVTRLLRNEAVEPMEVVHTRKNGTRFHAALSFSPIRDGSGQMVGLSCVARDITERRRMAEALQESEARFRTSVDAIEEGLILQGEDGAILFCNASAEHILGLSADQMRGRSSLDPLWRTIRADGTDFPGTDHPAMVALRDSAPQRNIVMGVYKPDGTLTWVNVTAVPLMHPSGGDAQGAAHSVVATFTDITERRRQDEALRHSQARLAEAQRVAQIGSWEYEIGTAKNIWSDELFRLFDRGPSEGELPSEALLSRYHPDDATRLKTLSAQAIQDGLPYELDIRILRPNGTVRWTHAIGHAERSENGQVTRLFGTLMDITERRLAEERFRILFEHSSDAHLLHGPDGIIDCNEATVALLRWGDKAQLLSQHPAVFSPEFQPDGNRSTDKIAEMERLAHENGCHRFEWTHQTMGGEEFPVEVTLTPVTLADGPVMLAVLHDLTERKIQEARIKDHAIILEFQKRQLEKANTELASLATTDGLTGLKNHRAFQERLAEELARARRYNTPLSVVLLDVDRFKHYNDAFGHPAGDEVLKQVGECLQSCARGADLAARYGGEEFVLILPQTDGQGAAVIAERVREVIAQAHWPKRAVTVSLGVASLSTETGAGGDLIARADEAMYRAKAKGRNQVERV